MPEELTSPEESTLPEVAGDADGSHRREVEHALDEDDTQLGDVWKRRKQNLDRATIAKDLRVSGVYNVWQRIDAIVDGKVPKSPSLARECASALRGFSRRHEESLSEETITELKRRATECDGVANDSEKKKEEARIIERETRTHARTDDRGPGIYVYTLPHYHDNPVKPVKGEEKENGASDRTYYKIGRTEVDARGRVQSAKREAGLTGLPETPLMLKRYKAPDGADLIDIEKKIHRLLEDADHLRNKGATKGTEWFLTHLKFLDAIAAILGLEVAFEHRAE